MITSSSYKQAATMIVYWFRVFFWPTIPELFRMFLYAFFFVPMRAWVPCFLTLNFFFDVKFFFDIGVGCGLQSGRRHVDTRRQHGQRTPLHFQKTRKCLTICHACAPTPFSKSPRAPPRQLRPPPTAELGVQVLPCYKVHRHSRTDTSGPGAHLPSLLPL